MKRIILTIAVTLAIGGAASGQTAEEVKVIFEDAKYLGVNNIGFCPTDERHRRLAREIKTMYPALAKRAKVTDSQLEDQICRLGRATSIAGMAKYIETTNLECLNSLTEKAASRIKRGAKTTRRQNISAFSNSKITDSQLAEAACRWERKHYRIGWSEYKKNRKKK